MTFKTKAARHSFLNLISFNNDVPLIAAAIWFLPVTGWNTSK